MRLPGGVGLIILDNLCKSYGSGKHAVTVIDHVSMEVTKGEIFGIIGQSGAGKSTLLRCVNLLARPDSGSVTVGGVELTRLNTRELQAQRRKIGMIFQHFNLLSTLTARDNVAFPLRLEGLSRQEIRRRADELLEMVGMSAHADKYPAQLSGGQKQRIGIARALAGRPDVLLCDEATSALDQETTRSVLALLQDINRKLGVTILLVTHEIEVVRAICDRVAVMQRGQIVESGRTADLLLRPGHPATRELLRQTEDPDGGDASGSDAGGTIIRVLYSGDSAGKPALSEAVRGTSVQFVILHGTVSRIRDVPYGRMTIRLTGPSGETASVIGRLREQGWEVETPDVL
nr:ATP-binding cassette domain-containing protein [Thermobacillus xylanilyticus]